MLTIAEESTALTGVSRPTYVGGLGFSLKWNMGWMNDTLRYMRHDPIHRNYHHDELTFSLIYAFHENFVLPLSHDEVVHGKGSLLDQMPGDLWQKFANLRLLIRLHVDPSRQEAAVHGGRIRPVERMELRHQPAMAPAAMGIAPGPAEMVSDLNHLYRREPALYEVDFDSTGFEWIDCHNYDESVLGYMRKAKDPSTSWSWPATSRRCRGAHRIGMPECCWYDEIFNSDSSYYGGSNLGNGPGLMAEEISWHGRPASIRIAVPPLAVTVLKPRR